MSQKSWEGPDHSGLSRSWEEFYLRAKRLHWKISDTGAPDVSLLNISHSTF